MSFSSMNSKLKIFFSPCKLKSRFIEAILKKSKNLLLTWLQLIILLYGTVNSFLVNLPLITVLTIVPFSRSFQIFSFLESILFVTYFIGFTLFLSTLIQKTTTSMFVGIISSFSFTIVGIWSIFSENVILKIISYLTPYSYVYKGELLFMIPLLSLVFVLGSIILIRKKDL